ncbi:alpha/beta hydrolase [Sphingomonas abietis]|uniref:Alpha/beta hydrolase n=1 Tax=Sphingomonas abietis TaxID=3012344 RepID=A0ABY7NKK5_9SPHN|nr:alpha/beta hydrolase [Sphingomonas abietis]WBO21330.1 alpha/beta hydrolase [Sphingomonas abietis]
MPSKEMEAVIASLTDFPLDVAGQRDHYRKVWNSVPVDPDIHAKPAACGHIGSGDSEWVWSDHADPERVFIYFHGGGYVCGDPWMWRQFNGLLSKASGFYGLGFGYRLAPEHPFPAAIEDSLQGYQWLLDTGIKPSNIILVGDSAGGGLVLSVMMAARDRGVPLPAGGIALSPWTDLELSGETITLKTDPLTTVESATGMAKRFLGEADARNPLASVLYGDFSGLPPLHLEAGENDLLFSDSTRLVRRLEDYAVPVDFHATPGAIHSFPALASATPEGQAAIARMAAFMRTRLG